MRFIRRLGFGIQSPWAYSFVKDVLYERLRFYAYDDLSVLFPGRSKAEVRRDEQLFRLVNHFRPERILVVGGCGDSSLEYMRAANRAAEVVVVTSDSPSDVPVVSAPFVYIGAATPQDVARRVVDAGMSCGDCWTLVVDGIGGGNKILWRSLLTGMDGVLTFDMKYRGVAFFDSSRTSHNYVV